MATILAVDTSATPVSCAIMQDDRLLASYFAHTGQTHSQTLMPMIEQSLHAAALTVDKLDALAVNAGPGSFTGVRIGVATVKGLAFANDVPCISVSTLESMAENVAGLPGSMTVACVMDARCRQVYSALFSLENGAVSRLTEDKAMTIEQLGNKLATMTGPILLVGDGSALCYSLLSDTLPNISLAPAHLRYQHAASTAAVALRQLAAGETVAADRLLPVYLRLPQAERELRLRQQAENK